MNKGKGILENLRARAEATALWLVIHFFGLFPMATASSMGGAIARTLGPLLPVSDIARRNLSRAFPEKDPAEIKDLVRRMWDNLGRVVAEYPHLKTINIYDPQGPVRITGTENIDLLREDGAPGIFFSAHFGNWEIASMAASQRGVPVSMIYREPNNPYVDKMLQRARAESIEGDWTTKGKSAARRAVQVMAQKGHLAMLVDQKMNEGIAVPFFGHDAMTAPAIASLALRYDCPVVPAKVAREKGATFHMTIFPPLRFEKTGDTQADERAAMIQINQLMESWIREKPEQWLWLHRRWPES